MTADLIPFPARRMVGMAREVAAAVLAGSDTTGRDCERRMKDALRDHMATIGMDAVAIEHEVREFTETTVDEIQRQVRTEAGGNDDRPFRQGGRR